MRLINRVWRTLMEWAVVVSRLVPAAMLMQCALFTVQRDRPVYDTQPNIRSAECLFGTCPGATFLCSMLEYIYILNLRHPTPRLLVTFVKIISRNTGCAGCRDRE